MANFQNRVCLRSMRAAVEALQNMNQDILEARTYCGFDGVGQYYEGASVTDAVSLMLLHQALELRRAIQRVLDDVTPNVPDPSEEDQGGDPLRIFSGRHTPDEGWYTYDEDDLVVDDTN